MCACVCMKHTNTHMYIGSNVWSNQTRIHTMFACTVSITYRIHKPFTPSQKSTQGACVPSNFVCLQNLCAFKICVPSKFVCLQNLCACKLCVPSKCAPSKFVCHQSFEIGAHFEVFSFTRRTSPTLPGTVPVLLLDLWVPDFGSACWYASVFLNVESQKWLLEPALAWCKPRENSTRLWLETLFIHDDEMTKKRQIIAYILCVKAACLLISLVFCLKFHALIPSFHLNESIALAHALQTHCSWSHLFSAYALYAFYAFYERSMRWGRTMHHLPFFYSTCSPTRTS